MARKVPVWLVLLPLLLLNACSASGGAPNASGMNLLIITLDTTRADAIGLYGNRDGVSPNIDALGRAGIVLAECYTPVPLTLPAHCSLFTGRYPIAHKVRNNGTYVLAADELTLAEAFKERGYQTAAVVASFTVSAKFGLGQGFDFYDEDFEGGTLIQNFNTEIPADAVYEKFRRWLERQDGKNFCSWVHFYDPHFPYVRHGEMPGRDKPSLWELYEGEVRFVDLYVGKIVEALRARNLYENTVIVLVGDHGEAFGEHKERGHGIFCYEESLRVPLVIHSPKLFQSPRSVAARVSLVDVMPTLLELFGAKVPAGVQGKSFLDLVEGKSEKRPRQVYFESLFGQEECNWAPITGLIDGAQKYISLPEPELYDLQRDARESKNLFAGDQELAKTLDKKLQDFIRGHAAAKVPSRRELTQSDVQKLTALGYVSGFSGNSRQMIDPKRGIDVYQEIVETKSLLAQKDFRQAEERLNAITAKNPGVELPDIYEISYELAKNKGEARRALDILEKAAAAFPEREGFKVSLAMEYIETGNLAAARDFCRRLLAADDRMTSAYVLLAEADERLDDSEAAAQDYEKAMSLEPQNARIKAKYAGLLLKKGDASRAQSILNELQGQPAALRSPEYIEAMSSLSQLLLAAGESDKALEIARNLTTVNPDSPAVWLNLGSAYFSLKNLDRALEYFEKALSLDKNFALAYSNVGLVYLSRFMAEYDSPLAEKALHYFERAIQLEPKLAVGYSGRASTLQAMNRLDQAVADYERAIKLDPEMMDAYINIGIALQQQGRNADALKYLDIFRQRFLPRLPPREREEFERLYSGIKGLNGRR